jgi:hypothetical protein
MNHPDIEPTTNKVNLLNILAFVILTLGVLFSLLIAAFGGLMGLFSLVNLGQYEEFNNQLFTALNLTMMMFTMSVLMVPGWLVSLQRLLNKQPAAQAQEQSNDRGMRLPNIALALTAVGLAAIYLLLQTFDGAQWLLPFLQIPAVIVPLFWIYRFTTRQYSPKKPRRNWFFLGLNLTIQPILTFSIELLLLVLIFLLVIFWLALNPAIFENVMAQFELFTDMTITMEQAEDLIAGYLENPWIFWLVQLFVAFLVPLVEEFIKPILLFRWIKRPLRAIDGFWLGLISGTAFTLIENFGNVSGIMPQDWFFVTFARYGTSFLHMATSAAMGWALMQTFIDRKVIRAVLVYCGVVILHGIWNFFALLAGFSVLPMENPLAIYSLSPIAPAILFLIAFLCAAILFIGGHALFRHSKASQPIPDESIST